MKKILFIITTIIFSFTASAQWVRINNSYGTIQNGIELSRALLYPTGCGVPVLNSADSARKKSGIYYDSCGHNFYVYDPPTHAWGIVFSSGSTIWGTITGTLSSQTDLNSALNSKQNSISFPFTVKKYLTGYNTFGSFPDSVKLYADTRYSLLGHTHIASQITDFTGAGRALISVVGGGTYNPVTGVINITAGGSSSLSFLYPLIKNVDTVSVTQATDSTDGYIAAGDFTKWNTAFGWGNHAGLYPTISRFNDSLTAVRNTGFVDSNALRTVINLKADSVKTNSDSTKLFYWVNGVSHEFYDIKTGLTGGDTTIFQTVLDSTGQPGQRVLWGLNNKIKSSPYFLYDSVNRKLVLGNTNISIGGTATKLYVTGNAQVSGSFTANSLIKSGGISSQFLKANGSVDANTYITSATYYDSLLMASRKWVRDSLTVVRNKEVADSLVLANKPSQNISNADLTMDANHTLQLDGKALLMRQGTHNLLILNPFGQSAMRSTDSTGDGNDAVFNAATTDTTANSYMSADYQDGTKTAKVEVNADASGSLATITSDSLYINATTSGSSPDYVWTLIDPATGSGHWAAGGVGDLTKIYAGGHLANTNDSTLNADSLSTNLRNEIAAKLAKSDSSIYYSKYRSDTSRTNIYTAIGGKQAAGSYLTVETDPVYLADSSNHYTKAAENAIFNTKQNTIPNLSDTSKYLKKTDSTGATGYTPLWKLSKTIKDSLDANAYRFRNSLKTGGDSLLHVVSTNEALFKTINITGATKVITDSSIVYSVPASGISKIGSPAYGLTRTNDSTYIADSLILASQIRLHNDSLVLATAINLKGTGTVSSVATGYGLSGGTITTTGTLILDSATVYGYVRGRGYLTSATMQNFANADLTATGNRTHNWAGYGYHQDSVSGYEITSLHDVSAGGGYIVVSNAGTILKQESYDKTIASTIQLLVSGGDFFASNSTKTSDFSVSPSHVDIAGWDSVRITKGVTYSGNTNYLSLVQDSLTGRIYRKAITSGGLGTVTSVATGYGLSGGTITTTGTVILDSVTLFTTALRRKDSTVYTSLYQNSLKLDKSHFIDSLNNYPFTIRTLGGAGDSINNNLSSTVLGLKRLVAGSNITLTQGDSSITIASTGGSLDTTTIYRNLNSKINADYVIEKVAYTYYARPSGSYTAYSGTNFSTVITSAMGQLTTGGIIYLNFVLADSIDVFTVPYSNITIQGRGKYLTKLKLKSNADAAGGFPKTGLINCVGHNYLTVKDIELDGNRTNQTLIDNGASQTARLFGIWLGSTGTTNYGTIKDCYIHDFTCNGIQITNATNCLIENVRGEDNNWNNISLMAADSNIIRNCQTHGGADVSISIEGFDNRVENCVVTDLDGVHGSVNSRWGIGIETQIYASARNVVTNCNVRGDSLKFGIVTRGTLNPTENIITNNYVHDLFRVAAVGISVNNATYTTVSNNKIVRINGQGIVFLGTTYSVIIGNDISQITYPLLSNPNQGICLTSSSLYNKVFSNSSTAKYALNIDAGSNYNLFVSNEFSGENASRDFVDAGTGNIFRSNYLGYSAISLKDDPTILKAGTTGVGTAPLKFTSGAPTTTPEIGSVHFQSGLWYIDSSNSVRDTIAGRKWVRNNITGIGSMVYPSAGIAVSTGSAWTTPITDNSANWNTIATTVGNDSTSWNNKQNTIPNLSDTSKYVEVQDSVLSYQYASNYDVKKSKDSVVALIPTNNNTLTNGAGYISSATFYDSSLMASKKFVNDSLAVIRSKILADSIALVAAITVTASSTTTFTNKRWTARVGTTTSSATPTINTDNVDIYKLTALAAAITSMTSSLSGTPVDGDILEIQFTDNGTARAITWGTSFASSSVALPTTTVISTTLTVVLQYFSTSSYGNTKWICVNSF